MNKSIAGGSSFIVVGVVFVAIGSGSQRAFFPIGLAFIAIGIVFIRRGRREKSDPVKQKTRTRVQRTPRDTHDRRFGDSPSALHSQ